MFDVDIIVEMIHSFLSMILQPLFVLKDVECTDMRRGTIGGKMQSDRLLMAGFFSFCDFLVQRCWLLDVALPTEKGQGWLAPIYSLWSLNRLSTSSPSLIGRCECFKPFAWGDPCSLFKPSLYHRTPSCWLLVFLKFKEVFGRQESRECHSLGEPWSPSWISWAIKNFINFLEFLKTCLTSGLY